jgi:hypothetical protein
MKYAWTRKGDMFHCEGGSHKVTVDELEKM